MLLMFSISCLQTTFNHAVMNRQLLCKYRVVSLFIHFFEAPLPKDSNDIMHDN
jgi:hypothetical protein